MAVKSELRVGSKVMPSHLRHGGEAAAVRGEGGRQKREPEGGEGRGGRRRQ
jgi:hypothetical protein